MNINVIFPKGFRIKNIASHLKDAVIELEKDEPGVREVVRLAGIGEWIKVVSPWCASGYGKGDVFLVDSINSIGGVWVKNQKAKDGASYIARDEYHVLEGYAPPAKCPPAWCPLKEPAVRIVKQDRYEIGAKVLLQSCETAEVVGVRGDWREYCLAIKGDDSRSFCKAQAIAGKVLPAEPEPKPEPKEPMAVFYCYKDYNGSGGLVKGKTYILNERGVLVYENGCRSVNMLSESNFRESYPNASSHLATQVKRPAEVGEWVLVVNAHNTLNNYKTGDIVQIVNPWEGLGDAYYKEEPGCYLDLDEYVVLDHYHPDEPKKHPLERVDKGDMFRCIDQDSSLDWHREDGDWVGNEKYNIANYAADTPEGREILNKWSLRDTLCHLMRRYAEMHGGEPEIGKRCFTVAPSKTSISEASIVEHNFGCPDSMTPRFWSCAAASDCIDKIIKPFLSAHPEFKW